MVLGSEKDKRMMNQIRVTGARGGFWAVVLLASFVAGCATPVYKEVFKGKSAYNARQFPVNKDTLYQATLRTICARNFIIEKEDREKGAILARRSFQYGKRTVILLLQANVSPDGKEEATLYVNVLQTTERYYVADRTRFFLWIVPLPGGGGKEGTHVKEGEKIVEDRRFYERFFVEVEEAVSRINPDEVRSVDEEEAAEDGVLVPEDTREEDVAVIPEEEALPQAEAVPLIDRQNPPQEED
jgi:hypothetical protein